MYKFLLRKTIEYYISWHIFYVIIPYWSFQVLHMEFGKGSLEHKVEKFIIYE